MKNRNLIQGEMKATNMKAILYAILAAIFYSINIPFSKILLNYVTPTILAGLLYLGAGIGIGIIFILKLNKVNKKELLSKSDFPYTLSMVVLDILAPICLMYGLINTTSATASLLNNFEIVATTIIAMVIFKEIVTIRLWIAIFLITISSIILSIENVLSLKLSWGAIFVLLATICWGFENNCTRRISDKNTFQIVTIKGICSGLGSLIIGLIINEKLPTLKISLIIMILGCVAYGLSIFFYIKAQSALGAAKTSAYYAIAPFIGVFLSFLIFKDGLSIQYFIALLLMIIGSIIGR